MDEPPLAHCPEYCGNDLDPGIGLDDPYLVDFSTRPSTPDQLRIEDELDRASLAGKNLLHVGVGNSALAIRFAARLNRVDGVTVCPQELERARSMEIANYRVWLVSKFSPRLREVLSQRYDFIVDNNLNGFACCQHHFWFMLASYWMFLRPNGRILTDQRGMDWTGGDQRRKLTYSDLQALEHRFPVEVSKFSEMVYSIRWMGEFHECVVSPAEAGLR
jgi:hypothetical protein